MTNPTTPEPLTVTPADDVREALYNILRWGTEGDEMGTVDRILAEVRSRASTPPADDVREACQQPPVGWHCSREAGHDGPCAARPIGQHDHKWEVHQGWAKCTLCGLEDEDPKWEPSSPPADDVREALRDIVRGGSYSRFPDDLPYADVVDRILAVFEVRPHGTVTDAEVEAAAEAICWAAEAESLLDVRMDMRAQYMREARAALEAAREVHP